MKRKRRKKKGAVRGRKAPVARMKPRQPDRRSHSVWILLKAQAMLNRKRFKMKRRPTDRSEELAAIAAEAGLRRARRLISWRRKLGDKKFFIALGKYLEKPPWKNELEAAEALVLAENRSIKPTDGIAEIKKMLKRKTMTTAHFCTLRSRLDPPKS
jgi:hypothetical protein